MEKRFEFQKKLECWIHDHETKRNYGEFDLCFLADLLNEQDEKIKELEKDVVKRKLKAEHMFNVWKEQSAKDLKRIVDLAEKVNQFVKSQNSKLIEILEDIIKTFEYSKVFCGSKSTELDVVSATAYNQCIDDMKVIINNQITELKKTRIY